MAMPLYYARQVWLAAISKHSGVSPIDDKKPWQKYLSQVQLKQAKEDVDTGLAAQGWTTHWALLQLGATNPISDQCQYLADTSDYTGLADPLHLAFAAVPKGTNAKARRKKSSPGRKRRKTGGSK